MLVYEGSFIKFFASTEKILHMQRKILEPWYIDFGVISSPMLLLQDTFLNFDHINKIHISNLLFFICKVDEWLDFRCLDVFFLSLLF